MDQGYSCGQPKFLGGCAKGILRVMDVIRLTPTTCCVEDECLRGYLQEKKSSMRDLLHTTMAFPGIINDEPT